MTSGFADPTLRLSFVELVERALAEDIRSGDVTSRALIPADKSGRGILLAKQPAVACALPLASLCFEVLDPSVKFHPEVEEGAFVPKGTVLARVEGPLCAILAAERTALNFVQRAMGIATATRAAVEAVKGTGCAILDTRKTAPGLRIVDKLAVAAGGGTNHRHALDDMILVKDNHVAAVGSITAAVARALAAAGHSLKVEIEVDSLEQLDELLRCPALPHVVLLDNFTPDLVREAVRRINGRLRTEVSGGITLDRLREYALAGADAISMGALTHSVKACDVSLDVEGS